MNSTQIGAINIAQWNARGFRNHVREFYQFMSDNAIQVACICETNFDQCDIAPSNPEYSLYRLDRTTSSVRSGGVAMIVRKEISHKLLAVPNTEILETFGIEIELSNNTFIRIFTAYLPGGTSHNEINQHYSNDLKKLIHHRQSYFIFGDFNSRHRLWYCSASNLAGRILYNLHQNSNILIQHPQEHTYFPADSTRQSSMLDLAVTNGLHQIVDTNTFPSSSDHNIVTYTIETDHTLQTQNARLIPCFKAANWQKYQDIVNQKIIDLQLNISSPYESTELLDEAINNFSEVLLDAQRQSVPLVSPNKYGIIITNEIKTMITSRNTLVRQSQRNRQQRPFLRTQINYLNSLIQLEITKLENKNFNSMISTFTNDNNNQQLWRTQKFLKNRRQFMPPLKINGQTLITPREKSNALAAQFVDNHTNPLSDHNVSFTNHVNSKVNRFLNNATPSVQEPTDQAEITEIARSLKNSKAPGLDKIHNRLIKMLPPMGFLYLAFIVNSCLHLSHFPSPWKHAKVIGIRKPGKPAHSPSSYRPISLLSSLSKVLERVILHRLNNHIYNNNIIPSQQHGFRPHHSTTTQLNRLTTHIKSALNNKLSTGLVSLDIEKAFDRTWHNGLVYKLICIKTPHYITKIIHSFLQNRTFQVYVNNQLSETHQINFGVPQGSVLSPTLYNIFTHDIPTTTNTEIALYADDTAVYCTSRFSKFIIKNLERAVRRINAHFRRFKMSMNESKTQVIFFTNRRTKQLPHRNFEAVDTEIEWSNNIKYLGLTLDRKLKFKDHITNSLTKINAATRILYSLINRKSRLNQNSKILLYKTALRPIITYACPVYSTIAKTHINKLQVCQNKLLKMGLDVPWYTRTSEIHQTSNTETIPEFINKLTNSFNNRLQFMGPD